MTCTHVTYENCMSEHTAHPSRPVDGTGRWVCCVHVSGSRVRVGVLQRRNRRCGLRVLGVGGGILRAGSARLLIAIASTMRAPKRLLSAAPRVSLSSRAYASAWIVGGF
eukprot:CAMPEP_0174723554 /NCGR_PEP_ID=MMETSP1094-20130205/41276_1 /TAXON_ID=156173 /ORGANISM="Chrysochromulina brevifilum, Strain UTEX LB 985" /LENGTH=108 /DNA_ID=CAMNT_0015924623 /DNA_START=35 /DNA_END=361 /DNA_ORIENTATION=-